MSLFEDTAWDPRYRMRMGSFLAIVVGFSFALWGGCSDLKLSWYSQRDPQSITAETLAQDGPGNNLHVLVTDYFTSPDGVGNDDVSWFIVNPAQRTPEQASILLKTTGGNDIFGVYVPEDGLQGMVRNGSGSLNADQRNAIKKLGRVDFDNLWIIDHNRQPPPWWSFLLKFGGGLLLVVAGGALFWWIGFDD